MSDSQRPIDGDSDTGDAVGPELRDLFRQTAPAEPSPANWERVRVAVAASVPPCGPPRRALGIALAAGILLAAGGLALSSRFRDTRPDVARDDSADPVGEYAVLQMAGENDVEIHSVRDGGWRAAVLGTSPIPKAIPWAGPKDVWLWSELPDEVFGFEPRMSGGFQDNPVIWADDSQR